MAEIYVPDFTNEVWRSLAGLASIPFTGDPPPDPPDPAGIIPDASWETMRDSAVSTMSFAPAESWYAANTGLEDGWTEDDLVAGSLVSTHDGQVIEGIVGSHFEARHNNVTWINCKAKGGATYGYRTNPTFGNPLVGNVITHCILDGGTSEGVPQDKRAVQVSHQATPGPALTITYTELYGWSSGIGSQGGCVAQYNYIHDFYGSSVEGAHVTSINARGSYNYFYRNFATSGGSSLISIYMDERSVHDVSITQNFMSGKFDPNNLPSYLRFIKVGDYSAASYNIVTGGDYFGEQVGVDFQFNFKGGGGDVPWGSNGNVSGTDLVLTTGAIV